MAVSITEIAIPDLNDLRAVKDEYPNVPIDNSHPLFSEKVVSLWDYGINGQSYYSGPNKITGEPLPDVKPDPLVRRSIAEKLVLAKDRLWDDDQLTRYLGGHAELIVKDALRSYNLQKHLFDIVWPKILHQTNPSWDEARIEKELPKVIGKPADDPNKPTPHMTGGAIDVDLIREDGTTIDFGHIRGDTNVSQTDYHEGRAVVEETPINPYAQVVRRALYWSMLEQDFTNHPYEFWHYSYGDQMWALFSGQSTAMYGRVVGSPDLQ